MGAVTEAEQALAYAPPEDRSRIKLAVTETNALAWSQSWSDRNDLGHTVVLFDILGQQLQDSNIEFSQLWNTRWVTADSQTTPALSDAVDKSNNFQASGRVVSVWSQFLLTHMVSATGSQKVKAFASWSATTGAVSVFLLNRTHHRDTRRSRWQASTPIPIGGCCE